MILTIVFDCSDICLLLDKLVFDFIWFCLQPTYQTFSIYAHIVGGKPDFMTSFLGLVMSSNIFYHSLRILKTKFSNWLDASLESLQIIHVKMTSYLKPTLWLWRHCCFCVEENRSWKFYYVYLCRDDAIMKGLDDVCG